MCPFCGYPLSHVLSTEVYETFIKRRRRCKRCGGMFWGEETYAGIIQPPREDGRLKEPET